MKSESRGLDLPLNKTEQAWWAGIPAAGLLDLKLPWLNDDAVDPILSECCCPGHHFREVGSYKSIPGCGTGADLTNRDQI